MILGKIFNIIIYNAKTETWDKLYEVNIIIIINII